MPGIFLSRRALSVEGPALSGLASNGIGKLVPLRLEGVEGINRLFEYRLTLQTPDALSLSLDMEANYPLGSWIGKELTCKIELEGTGSFIAGALGNAGLSNIGAGTREISGLVTDARFIGLESRHALYELTIRPWLHLSTLTSDCKVFQNLTAVEVIEQVLSEYAYPLDKHLIEDYPQRDYVVQYNETDFEFVSRLLQEWGINYHFEHSAGSHRLVLSDHNAAFEPSASAAYQQISYAPPGYKIDEEYIHAFSPREALTSGSYKSLEYDYTRPRALLEAGAQAPRNTGHAQSEVFRWRGDDAGSDYSHGNEHIALSSNLHTSISAGKVASTFKDKHKNISCRKGVLALLCMKLVFLDTKSRPLTPTQLFHLPPWGLQ